MCGDIFAATILWRGSLLGQFADDRASDFPTSCFRGCGGRVVGVAEAGRAKAWACSGRVAAICVLVLMISAF
jgi:hypothetical protein